ncbi:MAG: hypothetical protein KME02_15665 [Aphanothece saxicola GSE-SYN-MK-01-06B]|jgi:hypothetical protein|nr:hypothetical protein [Aphanothece saxicola GSE-SYN-MK-01-06B]
MIGNGKSVASHHTPGPSEALLLAILAAAAISTGVCFGLFHVPNMFMGMGWVGAIQGSWRP